MRKASYGKVSGIKSVFRLCLCLVVCSVLALAGTNMLVPTPAQAICVIVPPPPWTECVYYSHTFTAYANVGTYSGTDKYTCSVQGFSGYQNPQLPAGFTWNGATLSGCPPPGSGGKTYHIGLLTQEYVNGGYYPKLPGGPQLFEKYVDLTINAGPPGCACTGTGGGLPQLQLPPTIPQAPTTYTFTVSIGPGLTEGETPVLIDGKKKADLGGGESEDFEAAIGTSPMVSVKSPITGQQGNRFTVKDTAEKKVSEGDTSAYFDYAPAVYIEFVTDPSGLTALPGTDWYSIGDKAQSSAPATVDSGTSGTQYQFAYWSLPNGQKSQMKSLSLTASAPATVTAVYDTYHKLTVSSAYGEDDTTWHKAGEEVAWQVKTPQVPMEGLLGLLGGKTKAVKPGGEITMDGPKNITVEYKPSYPWLVLILIAAVVIGGGFFAYRRLAVARAAEPVTEVRATTKAAARPAKPAVAKKATVKAKAPKTKPVTKATPKAKAATKAAAKTKPAAESKFCPKCGDPVEKDEVFCNNCGKKLR